MKYLPLITLLLSSSLMGLTLSEIKDKPASRQKNFLIWQFLHQDINASQAAEAFYQIEQVNERFLFDYAAKTDEVEIKYTVGCLQMKASELTSIINDDCLMLALTPAKATALTKETRENIAKRLNSKFGNVEWLRTMNQEEFFVSDANLTHEITLFRLAGGTFRQANFNHPLSTQMLESLTKHPQFSSVAFIAITDPAMEQLQQSLSTISAQTKFDPHTHFYLGLNAIRYGSMINALEHLKIAQQRYYSVIERDKATFWLYQITQDTQYLDALSHSLDINMYVLYAREMQGIPTENYFTTLPTRDNPNSIRGIDPFEWREFSQKALASTPESLSKLIDQTDGNESVGIQGYLLERMYEPYIHNFTMAYDQYMTHLSNDKKALLYALMRQETRFIPGLISRSFALGLMQIMPFNVDTISRVHPLKPKTYFDMLTPELSIAYAISHLKHLEDRLYNPLLIAYAYNAGLGSTKRLLTEAKRFLPGPYEPFMSMELMANDENREYGKRVLANYVIYKKILGEEVRISAFFDNVIQPSQSDYFRAEALKKSFVPLQSE